MLESVGISKKLTIDQLVGLLSDIFPKIQFQHVEIESLNTLSKGCVGFFTYYNDSEFPLQIDLLIRYQDNTDLREQFLAQAISQRLKCAAIVGYQKQGSSQPHKNLIFEDDKVYLASDLDSKLAGEGEEAVMRIKELKDFQVASFGDDGNLID